MARLAALAQRFPTRELELRRLYVHDEEFRAVCDDYEEALRVLRHWQIVARNVSRTEEYRQLAAELESEVVALLDAASATPATGDKLWGQHLGGGIGGGVITYAAGGAQKVAVAAGFTSPMWPTKQTTAKVMVLGLDDAATAE